MADSRQQEEGEKKRRKEKKINILFHSERRVDSKSESGRGSQKRR